MTNKFYPTLTAWCFGKCEICSRTEQTKLAEMIDGDYYLCKGCWETYQKEANNLLGYKYVEGFYYGVN